MYLMGGSGKRKLTWDRLDACQSQGDILMERFHFKLDFGQTVISIRSLQPYNCLLSYNIEDTESNGEIQINVKLRRLPIRLCGRELPLMQSMSGTTLQNMTHTS